MNVSLNALKLANLMDMTRMSAEGNLKTSAEKTSGYVFADANGNVHNVRGFTLSKGVAAQNLALRQKLVSIFSEAHASTAFLNEVRQKLGLGADSSRASAEADKPLSRRELKVLLKSFNEGTFETSDKKMAPSHEFRSAEIRHGEAAGWVNVDTFEGFREKALGALEHCPNEITPEMRETLKGEIQGTTSHEILEQMAEGFLQGNIDPYPFGHGPRSLDLPEGIAKNFANEVLNDMNSDSPAPSDSTVLSRMKVDVNREWSITIGGMKLPKEREVENQDQSFKDIFDKFFTKEESATIRNKMLGMVNQCIYTPLSVQPLLSGILPGGAMEESQPKAPVLEHRIDVTRSEEGHIQVSVRILNKGFPYMCSPDTLQGMKGPIVLADADTNYRETTVSYEFAKGADGNWEVNFLQKPQVSYQYGHRLTADECRKMVMDKVDGLLNDPELLATKIRQSYEDLKASLNNSIETCQTTLDRLIRKNAPKSVVEGTRAQLATYHEELDALKVLDDQDVKTFCARPDAREKLLSKLKGMNLPLSKAALGRWDEESVMAAIRQVIEKSIANG